MNHIQQNSRALADMFRVLSLSAMVFILTYAIIDAATIKQCDMVSVPAYVLRALICVLSIIHIMKMRREDEQANAQPCRKLVCVECRRVIREGVEPLEHGLCADPNCYEARNEV